MGDVTNASGGVITGLISISISGTSLTGNIINDGTSGGISTPGAMYGNIINNNKIISTGAAIFANGNTGSIINNGSITGGDFGVYTLFGVSGSVENTGTIKTDGEGLFISPNGTTGGSVSNSGTIIVGGVLAGGGLHIQGPVLGAVTNSGTLSGPYVGIFDTTIGTISGGIVNTATGVINGSIPGATSHYIDYGIYVGTGAGSVTKGVTNAGSITAFEGIAVYASTSGPIVNTGSITAPAAAPALIYGGPAAAIYAAMSNAANTIDQNGGVITGAIDLSAHGDTVNIAGGVINGAIDGDVAANGANAGTVNFILGPGGSFTTGGPLDVAAINITSGMVTLANDVTVFGAFTNNAGLELSGANARTINGRFVQSAGGDLIVPVTPTGAGVLNVTGSASVAGTVTFAYAPGTYSAGAFTFLKSTGLSGTFSTVSASTTQPLLVGFSQAVSYTADDASLVLSPAIIVTAIGPLDGTLFSAAAFAFGQANEDDAARLLGRTLPGGGGNTFYNFGPLDGPAARVWMDGIGSNIDAQPALGAPRFHSGAAGVEGGVDMTPGAGWRLGADLGYQSQSLTDSTGGAASGNLVRGGLYASDTLGLLGLSATLSYAHDNEDFARAPGFGAALSSRGIDEVTGAVQASGSFAVGPAVITPAAGAIIADVWGAAFQEIDARSAAFALAGAPLSFVTVSPFVTAGLSRQFMTEGGVAFTPDADVGYRYDEGARGAAQTLIAPDGTVFADNRARLDPNTLLIGASLTAHKGAWSAFVKYRADIASGWSDQSVQGGMRIAF